MRTASRDEIVVTTVRYDTKHAPFDRDFPHVSGLGIVVGKLGSSLNVWVPERNKAYWMPRGDCEVLHGNLA